MPEFPDIPPSLAILLSIVSLFFLGGTGIVWAVRRDVREARAAPTADEAQRLANVKLTQEIAAALREGITDQLADYKGLMEAARADARAAREDAGRARADAQAAWVEAERSKQEAADARAEAVQAKSEAATFRTKIDQRLSKVEKLLEQNGISIPDWWHEPL